MAEVESTVITKDAVAAKVAAAIGAGQPQITDIVKREDYKTDDEYIDALVAEQVKRSTPEWQAARRKVARELEKQQERETRAAQREEYAEILKSVKLEDLDKRQIDKQAAELAQRDLAAGRIFASDLGKRIAEHAEKLTEAKKRDLAAGIQFNRALRGK